MASIEKRNGRFRVSFRFGGVKHNRALKTRSEDEALARCRRLEENIRLVDCGRLSIPPGADIATFLLSDGKLDARPLACGPLTIANLFEVYFGELPDGALEPTTVQGLRIHERHLVRLLGARFGIQAMSVVDLQNYVKLRAKEKGLRGRCVSSTTIAKELKSLRTIWNWAVATDRLTGEFPNKGLKLPKIAEKPSFQTFEAITRQIKSAGVDAVTAAGLWECVYLSREEIDALLDHIESASLQPFVYPMFAMAAHTGARRSEILRAQIEDVQDDSIVIQERKRVRGKASTRRVPISRRLHAALEKWRESHPGGPHLFCQLNVERSRKNRSEPEPITRDEAVDHFKRAVRGSKWSVLPGWHCLRHSFISNCASKGVDQRMIDEWVGHTTEEMRRRYRHLFPSTQREALNSVFG